MRKNKNNNKLLAVKEASGNLGKGVFAKKDIPEGTEIGVWATKELGGVVRYLIKGEWYETRILGRWANHSEDPNTYYEREPDHLVLFSKGIKEGEQVFANYWWANEEFGFKSDLLE